MSNLRRRATVSAFLAKVKDKKNKLYKSRKSRSASNLAAIPSGPYGTLPLTSFGTIAGDEASRNSLDDITNHPDNLTRNPSLQVLGAFTTALRLDAKIHQGRTYLTNQFLLFVSTPGTTTVRVRIMLRDILAVKPQKYEGEGSALEIVGPTSIIHFVNVAHLDAIMKILTDLLNPDTQQSSLDELAYAAPFDTRDLGCILSVQSLPATPESIFEFFLVSNLGLYNYRKRKSDKEGTDFRRTRWLLDKETGKRMRRVVIFSTSFGTETGKEQLLTVKQTITTNTPNLVVVDMAVVPSFDRSFAGVALRWIIRQHQAVGEVSCELRVSASFPHDNNANLEECITGQVSKLIDEFRKGDVREAAEGMEVATLALMPTLSKDTIWYASNLHEVWHDISAFALRPVRSYLLSNSLIIGAILVPCYLLTLVGRLLWYLVAPSPMTVNRMELDITAALEAEAELGKQLWLLRKRLSGTIETT